MVTLHDPSVKDVQRAYRRFPWLTVPDRKAIKAVFNLIVYGDTDGRIVMSGLEIAWNEPDDTGKVPITLRMV